MAETPTRLLTADDLLAMPDDGFHRYELRRGELIAMVPPGFEHARNSDNLRDLLAPYVREQRLGRASSSECGFRLTSDPDTVRAPDVWFIRAERLGEVGEPIGYWPGAPDLAAEFVSPSDTAEEVQEKVADYLAAGARLVWVVYARRRQVVVWRADGTTAVLGADDTLAGEDVIPGFACRVAEIFST